MSAPGAAARQVSVAGRFVAARIQADDHRQERPRDAAAHHASHGVRQLRPPPAGLPDGRTGARDWRGDRGDQVAANGRHADGLRPGSRRLPDVEQRHRPRTRRHQPALRAHHRAAQPDAAAGGRAAVQGRRQQSSRAFPIRTTFRRAAVRSRTSSRFRSAAGSSASAATCTTMAWRCGWKTCAPARCWPACTRSTTPPVR